MLRVQVSYIFFFIKEEIGKKEKNREKRRERKNAFAQISSTSRSLFICGPIKLKFGGEV